jgi:hypothetical protein
MLYVASEAALRRREGPEIHVESVNADRAVVQQWFSLPEIQYVGAHTGCSCGFPSVVADEPIAYYDGFFDEMDDRANDLASVRALFDLLDEALEHSSMVELFPVWAGDEAEAPIGFVQIDRAELTPEKFFFTEHFLYRVT